LKQGIVNRVKELRSRAGLSQEELGRAVGVSRQSIISIERGRYVPSLQLALRMAAFFKCPADELFQLEDDE
jgi:putative transcriptional regulator